MKTTDPQYQDYVKIIFTISDISDNADDNDPALKNSLEAKFDKDFNDFKLSFARKVVTRTKVTENIAKGKSTREGMDEEGMRKLMKEAEKRSFTTSEIASLKTDFIDERLTLLAKVPLNEFETLDIRRIRRLRAFLEAKKVVNQPISVKSVNSFPQFFTANVPDDKKELFASMLRDEFSIETGLGIRYMIEGLKMLEILPKKYKWGDKENLFQSMRKYFDRHIGEKTGIFDKDVIYQKGMDKDNIDNAIDRINPLYLKVTSSQ